MKNKGAIDLIAKPKPSSKLKLNLGLPYYHFKPPTHKSIILALKIKKCIPNLIYKFNFTSKFSFWLIPPFPPTTNHPGKKLKSLLSWKPEKVPSEII